MRLSPYVFSPYAFSPYAFYQSLSSPLDLICVFRQHPERRYFPPCLLGVAVQRQCRFERRQGVLVRPHRSGEGVRPARFDGARGADDTAVGIDVLRFPTFTDYVGLTPGTLIMVSRLNFKSDGTIPATASDGLNPDTSRPLQIYAVSLPIGMTPSFTRMTKIPPVTFFFASTQPITSDTRIRMSFTLASPELGTGNLEQVILCFTLISSQKRCPLI